MKIFIKVSFLLLIILGFISQGIAAADLEINTPAISALKKSMQDRHGYLATYYANGVVGFTRDGRIQLRDANAVPLAQRQNVSSLVAAENQDRNALYREIARANNHPDWESEIRTTFAQRWIEKAQSGWWYQNSKGEWVKK